MIEAITAALTSVLEWFGTIITALLGGTGIGQLLPVLVIAVGISLVLLTIKVVRKMAWGA